MDELNDMLQRDAEIDQQIFIEIRDVLNEGIEYIEDKDNRDSIIAAAIPAIQNILDEKEKGFENKIKSNAFNKKPEKVPQALYKSYQKGKIFLVHFYKIIRELLNVYEFKREYFGDNIKKLNDYLKNHLHFKNVNLKGIKFGIGSFDLCLFIEKINKIWVQEDRNYREKILETRKALLRFIGEIIFGTIGEKIGIGLFKPGLSQLIAVFFLVYFLSEFGGDLFEEINEMLNDAAKKLAGIAGDNDDDDGGLGLGFFGFGRRKKKDNDDDNDNDDDDGDDPPFPPCPAFAMAMRTGGVEFHLPKQINNCTNFFCFNKCHYFAFEYDDLNIQEIIDLVNSKFLINNIEVKSLDEIYDTILKEITYGFLCKKELPSISLNFNKDGLLYSIMDKYYKNTLTGNILTFLDYYLKSYTNGGFFKEEFIYEWQNKQNQNFDYLSGNITDFKKYIYDLKNEPNQVNYCSIYDLVDIGITETYEKNYISAFRIIGNLDSNLSYYKNLFFPNCFYYTQYDFDIMPKWKKEINEEIINKIKKNSGEKNKEKNFNKNKGIQEEKQSFWKKYIK